MIDPNEDLRPLVEEYEKVIVRAKDIAAEADLAGDVKTYDLVQTILGGFFS